MRPFWFHSTHADGCEPIGILTFDQGHVVGSPAGFEADLSLSNAGVA